MVFFSFLQNTSCIRKPPVISGGGGGVGISYTFPLDPPLPLNTLSFIGSCTINVGIR